MTDTPPHIAALQLKLWLERTPGERLLQALKNNEAVYLMFKNARENLARQQAEEKAKKTWEDQQQP